MLGKIWVRQAQAAIRHRLQARITVVGPQRIAPRRDEIDHPLKLIARQAGIGRSTAHFLEQCLRQKRSGARRAPYVLGQHIETARPDRRRILSAHGSGIERSLAFQHFKAVGWHQQRPRWLIQPVVGTADALRQTARPFWRANMNDQVHVAPIDAEIQGRRCDHGPQASGRHRRLDLAPLTHIE